MSSVIVQVISIIMGLVIPKLIIEGYGSAMNGLISSTNQVVGYFGIIEGGVAAAAGASLYRPFAENNQTRINAIMTAVKQFYHKTGLIFGGLMMVLCLIYPLYLRSQMEFTVASSVMLLLSVISVLGYLVFNKYNMILVTDQKHYITLLSSAAVNLAICIAQMLLLRFSANIIAVVAVVPAFSLIRLFMIRAYIRRNYPFITYHGVADHSAIREKWNALSMNVSQMCKVAIPIIVLSLMCDLKVVSVYTVYSMLFRIGSSIIEMSNNSITAIFGNVMAKESSHQIKRAYELSETLISMVIAVLSGCFFCLTESFIGLYIGEESDISYQAPILMISFIINEAILNIRFSPKIAIKATGRLKEARNSGLIEIIICSVLTPLAVWLFGYQAVLIGSILSGLSQTIYLTKFSYQNIIQISAVSLFKKLGVNLAACILGILAVQILVTFEITGYIRWLCAALLTGGILLAMVLLFNAVFLKDYIFKIVKKHM